MPSFIGTRASAGPSSSAILSGSITIPADTAMLTSRHAMRRTSSSEANITAVELLDGETVVGTLVEKVHFGADRPIVAIFSLLEPPAGTYTLRATTSGGSISQQGWIADCLENVDLTDPIRATNTNAASGVSSTINVSSNDTDMVLDTLNIQADVSNVTPNSGQTLTGSVIADGSHISLGCSVKDSAGASTTTMGWTWTTSRAWRYAAISIKHAAPVVDPPEPPILDGDPDGNDALIDIIVEDEALDHYLFRRVQGEDDFTRLAHFLPGDISGGVITYRDTDVNRGPTYEYVATAYDINEDLESDDSNLVQVTIAALVGPVWHEADTKVNPTTGMNAVGLRPDNVSAGNALVALIFTHDRWRHEELTSVPTGWVHLFSHGQSGTPFTRPWVHGYVLPSTTGSEPSSYTWEGTEDAVSIVTVIGRVTGHSVSTFLDAAPTFTNSSANSVDSLTLPALDVFTDGSLLIGAWLARGTSATWTAPVGMPTLAVDGSAEPAYLIAGQTTEAGSISRTAEIDPALRMAGGMIAIRPTAGAEPTPTGLGASLVEGEGDRQVFLSWEDNTNGTAPHKVFLDSTEIDEVPAGDSTYVVEDLAPGTQHSLHVAAVSGGQDWPSDPVLITTAPARPTSVSATLNGAMVDIEIAVVDATATTRLYWLHEEDDEPVLVEEYAPDTAVGGVIEDTVGPLSLPGQYTFIATAVDGEERESGFSAGDSVTYVALIAGSGGMPAGPALVMAASRHRPGKRPEPPPPDTTAASVTLPPDQEAFTLAPEQTKQLTPTTRNAAGEPIEDGHTYESQNEAVATVTSGGLSQGVSEGQAPAIIIVRSMQDAQIFAEAAVTVVAPTGIPAIGPNEPSGMTEAYRIDGTSKVAGDINMNVNPRWAGTSFDNDGDPNKFVAVVQDAEAANGSAIQYRFPRGFRSNDPPGMAFRDQWPLSWSADEVYHLTRYKFHPQWHTHPVGQKLWLGGFHSQTRISDATPTGLVFELPAHGYPPLGLRFMDQYDGTTWVAPNPQGIPGALALGTYWQAETWYKRQTAWNTSDGALKIWINEQLLIDLNNVRWIETQNHGNGTPKDMRFSGHQIHPYWGGGNHQWKGYNRTGSGTTQDPYVYTLRSDWEDESRIDWINMDYHIIKIKPGDP